MKPLTPGFGEQYMRSAITGLLLFLTKREVIIFAVRAHFASPFQITGDLFLIHLFIVGILICVILHIYHHAVAQYHIENYGKHTADCTQKRICIASS